MRMENAVTRRTLIPLPEVRSTLHLGGYSTSHRSDSQGIQIKPPAAPPDTGE